VAARLEIGAENVARGVRRRRRAICSPARRAAPAPIR